MDFFIWWIKLIYPVQGDEKSGPDYSLTQRFFPSSQVSIAVGLAGFACVLLLVIFVLINKYGRRSKFGMKGKSPQVDRQADSSVSSAFLPVASLCRKPVPPANRLTSKPQRIRNCTYTATSLYFYCTLATSPGLVLKKKELGWDYELPIVAGVLSSCMQAPILIPTYRQLDHFQKTARM